MLIRKQLSSSALSLALWALLPAACAAPDGGTSPAAQSSAYEPAALMFHFGGLDATLSDPRDAGLLRALELLDERLLEVLAEAPVTPPPGLAELLCEVLTAPHTLRLEPADPADGFSPTRLRAQLTVHTATAAEADALATRVGALLSMVLPPPQTSAEGLASIELPFGKLSYGRLEGDTSFVLALGKPVLEPARPATELPPDATLLFALELNVAALRPALEPWLAMAGPEAAEMLEQFETFGLLGEDAMWFRAAAGRLDDRSLSCMRSGNGFLQAQRQGTAASEPLSAADFGLVPADATMASISKVRLGGMLGILEATRQPDMPDPLEVLDSFMGIRLEADVLQHMGSTVGLYLSDTTGGGGLASTVMFATLENEAGLALTLQNAARRLDELMRDESGGMFRIRSWEHAGAACLSLSFPSLPVPVEPSLAVAHGVLLLGATPQALVGALEHVSAGGPGLMSQTGFRSAVNGPLDDLYAVSFQDTPRLLREGYGWATLLSSALANAVRSSDGRREPGLVLPPYAQLAAGCRPTVACTRLDGDDVLMLTEGDSSVLGNLSAAMVATPSVGALVGVGLMATIVMPRLVQGVSTTQNQRVLMDFAILEEALTHYAIENDGRYPDSLQELTATNEDGNTYLQDGAVPLDPWGNEYVYRIPDGPHSAPLVLTFGRDKLPGGEGEDADIGNDQF